MANNISNSKHWLGMNASQILEYWEKTQSLEKKLFLKKIQNSDANTLFAISKTFEIKPSPSTVAIGNAQSRADDTEFQSNAGS